RQGVTLQPGQLRAAGDSQVKQLVEQLAIEGLAFGGALYLDEFAVARAHDIHVRLGRDVLAVAQVEPRLAVDDAHADGGNRGSQRVALAPVPAPQPADRVREGDVPAGYRGCSGSAVGLQHIAVDHDRVLAERL